MNKIKSGDQVIVTTGKNKGVVAKVLRVLGKRIVVEGVSLVKKHVRPNPQKGIEGGIVTREAPIDASNVAIYNAATKKADRVGFKVESDGTKTRVFKSSGEAIK
jgi:large subunit ribosomal protein L24